ncbi:MAG: hypothetical protein AB7N76_33580 [Planctomycetota bacterium]
MRTRLEDLAEDPSSRPALRQTTVARGPSLSEGRPIPAGDARPGGPPCLLAFACLRRGLRADCDELRLLRRLTAPRPRGRDATLVARYARLAPQIVARLNAEPGAQARWDEVYEWLVLPCAALVRAGDERGARELLAVWLDDLAAEVLVCEPEA